MAKSKKKRLNVKFLVILTGAVAAVLVVAVIAGYFYKQSPGRAIRRAQEAEQKGDWDTAAGQWAKAARYSNNKPEYNLNAINASLHQTTRDSGEEILNNIFGAYAAVLASDPTNLDALRGEMRLRYQSGRLDQPSADAQTRAVRRLAGEILKQVPDDAEARTLQALATLNLSGFTGEGVTTAQTDQARQDLEQVALNQPGDGLAMTVLALRRLNDADQARQANDPAEALTKWQSAVALVDQVADKAGDLKAGATLDEIALRRRMGEAYRTAALLKPYLDAAMLAKNGTPVTGEQARQLQDDPLTKGTADKSLAALAAAADALDEDRDKLTDVYRATLVQYADALQQRGQMPEAEAVLRRLVAARPWDANSASTLARFLQQTGNVQEAVAVLREQRKRDEQPLPDLTGFSGLIARSARLGIQPQLADLLLARRDQVTEPQEKEALLKEAGDLFAAFDSVRLARGYNDTAEITRIRGQLQLARGEVVNALQTFNTALRLTDNARTADAQYERLRTLDLIVKGNGQLGQLGPIQRALEEMARLRPGNAAIQEQLAKTLLAQGETARAKAIIDALLKIAPDNVAYQQLAIQATPADEQEAGYAKLPESDPAQRRLKLQAAERLQKRDEVIRLARAALADTPDDTKLALGLAQVLAADGQKDEARAVLEKLKGTVPTADALLTQLDDGTEAAIEKMPPGVNKLTLQARIAAAQGDKAGAIDKFKAAHDLEPANDAVSNALFDAYVNDDRADDAATLAETLKKDNADRMNGRGYDLRLLLARGQTDRAVREAQSLANDFPQLAEAQGLQGATLLRAGRAADAVQGYRRALDLSPGNVTLLSGMVTALQAAGRGGEVKPYLDAALRVEPNNPAARNAQTAYELQYGDAQAVIAKRRDAAAANPDDANRQLSLGQALLAAGQSRRQEGAADGGPEAQKFLTAGVDAFRSGLAKFPADARFLQGLIAAAVQAGGKSLDAVAPTVDAALTGDGAAALAADPRTAASAAEFYVAQGEPAKAENVLRQAIAAGGDARPRSQTAALLLGLSETVARQGRVDDAVAVLGGYDDVPAVLERKVNLLATRAANNPGDQAAYDAMRQASDGPLEAGKLTPGAVNAVAFAEMQRGGLERAETLLAKSDADRPDDSRTLFFRAAVEARKPGGSLERATQLLDRARTLNPTDADVLRELARVQRLRGQTDAAAASLATLATLQPKDVRARLDLLNLLMSANPPRTAEAARVFREAEAAGIGQDPQLLLARARTELVRNRPDDAMTFAGQAVDKAKGTPQEASVLSAYLTLALQQNRAAAVLERTAPMAAAGATPPPWWVLRARGDALSRLNRRPEATEAYTKAYQTAQATPGAAAGVIREMAARLGFDAAYALVKPKVEVADGATADPEALEQAGTLYAVSGQTERAIALLKQADAAADTDAGKMSPEQRARLQSALGSLYLQTSPPQLDEAERALRASLKVNSQDLGSLNNLAYTLSTQAEQSGSGGADKRAEAVEFARQAYDVAKASAPAGKPAQPTVTDTYAWALAVKAMADNDAAGVTTALNLLREARSAAEDAGEPFPELYLHLSQTMAAGKDGAGAGEAARAGLALVARQREAKKQVDAAVEQQLQTALADAQKLEAGDDKAAAATPAAG